MRVNFRPSSAHVAQTVGSLDGADHIRNAADMTTDPPPTRHILPIFGGAEVTQWEPEDLPPKGQQAFDRFLSLTPEALVPAAGHVFAFYQDMMARLGGTGWLGVPLPDIAAPQDVWAHVTPTSLMIRSDWDDDGPWYVSLEANIPWEVEHGLIMVWEDGVHLVKVGRVDGHLTNANSYADPTLEDVVYAAMDPRFRTTRT